MQRAAYHTSNTSMFPALRGHRNLPRFHFGNYNDRTIAGAEAIKPLASRGLGVADWLDKLPAALTDNDNCTRLRMFKGLTILAAALAFSTGGHAAQ